MSDKQGGSGAEILIPIVIVGYAVVKAVEAVVAAITALLMGLVNILLIAAGVVAAVWVYRYITDEQYGHRKGVRKVERIENERRETLARLPKHLRQQADDYFRKKQEGIYDPNPKSRLDAIVERIRKWKKGGGE